MKPKTLERIAKKFSRLPSHFIDTSIILGTFLENEEFREECKDYLNRVGYKYRGYVPVSVIGEIFMIINERIESANDRELFFSFFDKLVQNRKMKFVGTVFEVYEKISEMKETDYKTEPLDALHLSIAITSNASTFVTLDKKLIHNHELENKFGIKILHPKEL